ncbi:RICIN domain-containing protein [Streptomyces sp. PA03-3a]|nr:RICIN domain-containing protein [Streptomyces sp. PA03-3a]
MGIRKTFAILTATLGLTAGAVAGANSASAFEPWLQNYALSEDGAFCATPFGGSESNGAYVTQWECDEDHNTSQRWHWYGNRIVNNNSGKCLTPYGGGTADGTILTIYDCNSDASQNWQVVYDAETAQSRIKNLQSKTYITTYGGSKTHGANLTLWRENNTDAQKWQF